MGYNSSGGPKGLGVFNNTPQTVADLNQLRDMIARVGNFREGNQADQDAVIGDALYEGLFFYRTDINRLDVCNGTGWDVVFQDWTSYSPTATAVTGGTITAKFQRVGKTVNVVIKHQLAGTNGGITGAVRYSLPIPAGDADVHQAGTVLFRDASPAGDYYGLVRLIAPDAFVAPIGTAGTYANFVSYLSPTVPHAWASGDFIEARFSYEVA